MKLNQEIYIRPCVSHKVSLMSMWQTKILESDHLLDSLDSKHILKQDCIISHTDSFVRLWPHEESSRVLNTWNKIHNIWRGFYITTDQYQDYYYQLYRVIQAAQIYCWDKPRLWFWIFMTFTHRSCYINLIKRWIQFTCTCRPAWSSKEKHSFNWRNKLFQVNIHKEFSSERPRQTQDLYRQI